MKTILELFDNSVKKFGDNPFFWDKIDDRYKAQSYKEVKHYVQCLASGLLDLGLKPGDKISLVSEGRCEWIISELAILSIGAISVPVSVKLDEASEMLFRIKHSNSKGIIASASQINKLKPVINELEKVEKIIIIKPDDNLPKKYASFDDIIGRGKQNLEKNLPSLNEIRDSITENHFVNISYTSGTTADPKGIILTHKNYAANVTQSVSLFEVPEHYKTLLILPWDHSFAHTVGIYSLMWGGASIASVEKGKTQSETLKNIGKNIKEIKPTFILSVPALAKSFRNNIERAISEKGNFTKSLYHAALKNAYKYNREGYNKGKGVALYRKWLHNLYDKLIFSKIRDNFGGKLRFFVGGGALLNIEMQKYFYALGIPMYQGYGLSEASPVISSNNPQSHKLGSSGKIVPNLEVKICDEKVNELPLGEKGEIVVRGDNVMYGYWKNEKATKETIVDGWLRTGDLGYLDQYGYLYVLGRYKSLLIGNDGEKFSPEGIETSLTDNSPLIEQCMLYNNQNPYTVGLIYPNKEALQSRLKQEGYIIKTDQAAKKALELIETEVNQFKGNGKYSHLYPHRWLPSAIGVIPEGFTEQNKMLNSTLKMVRRKITDHYLPRIKSMFTAEGRALDNKQNLDAVEIILNGKNGNQ